MSAGIHIGKQNMHEHTMSQIESMPVTGLCVCVHDAFLTILGWCFHRRVSIAQMLPYEGRWVPAGEGSMRHYVLKMEGSNVQSLYKGWCRKQRGHTSFYTERSVQRGPNVACNTYNNEISDFESSVLRSRVSKPPCKIPQAAANRPARPII